MVLRGGEEQLCQFPLSGSALVFKLGINTITDLNLVYTQFLKNQCHHNKTYPAVNEVACCEWCQQARQIRHAVGEGHEYSCKPR